MNTHESAAKKITTVFSDARYTKGDIDKIAMLCVIMSREPSIHDRVEYFSDRFMFHRETMEFGRDLDETFEVKDLFSGTFPDIMGA